MLCLFYTAVHNLKSSYISAHDVATVYKQYLRELPDPLLVKAYLPIYKMIAGIIVFVLISIITLMYIEYLTTIKQILILYKLNCWLKTKDDITFFQAHFDDFKPAIKAENVIT